MTCIICVNENPITKINPFTIEHVFPEAIGGDFSLKELVCKCCNQHLGLKVDKHLTSHFLILFHRHALGLKSKGRDIPSPFPELIDSYGRSMRVEIKNSKCVPIIYPTKKHKNENEVFYISGNESKEQTIKKLNKMLERKKLPELTEQKIDELFGSPRIKEEVFGHAEIEVDIVEYHRSMLKIAYELSVHFLGIKYMQDPVGEEIRKCLNYVHSCRLNSDRHWRNKFAIEYFVKSSVIPSSESFFSKKNTDLSEDLKFDQLDKCNVSFDRILDSLLYTDMGDLHLGHLIKVGNNLIFFVKIFNVFAGWFFISKTSDSYPHFNQESAVIKVRKRQVAL